MIIQFAKILVTNNFLKFKNKSSQVGTTEEAIANAEKIGYDTGFKAKHPFIKNKTIPVYVANFILMDYGTGAILDVLLTIRETMTLLRNIKLKL